MENDEKLPEHNPIENCQGCGKALPTWRLGSEIGTGRVRVWHNFCPASDADHNTINVCMECKMGKGKPRTRW